ncbi:MAG: CoA transferase [Lentisphaerota bacterium]
MEQALSGINVLDFGHYIAGPYAGMLLAEQGADVIKVERPGGDPLRKEPGFIVWNRSKRGITLDLKQAEGRRIAQELAKKADVIIENFHPGVADRLGIGYKTVQQLNPRAVYCSITGFGYNGPYRDLPGWEPIVAALASVFTGQVGGVVGEAPPLYVVMPMPSYYCALMSSFSIATALWAREATGQGQMVDMSLFNAILSAQAICINDFTGMPRSTVLYPPQGRFPLYRLYPGKDGKWFIIALGNLTFFAKFAIAMGHEEWVTDPRFEGHPFAIYPPRSTDLIAMFRELFSTKTRDEWLELLRAADLPCDAVQTVEEFMDDPQVLANGMVEWVEQPPLGKVREMGVPVKFQLTPGSIKGPCPALGQHTAEVLGEIGYSAQDIDKLKEQRVI